MRFRSRALIVALALLPVAPLAACGADDGATSDDAAGAGDAPAGIVRDPAPDVSGVSLPDASDGDRPFATVADDGSVLLVYFGYTSCPDVCPTTLADVRTAREELGDDADRLDLAMVTIDPHRDTGDVLTRYVQTFVPGAHALRTDDPGALRRAADAFGADFTVEERPGGEPEVAHTGTLYAVGDEGDLVLQWSFGTSADDLASDLRNLLDQA